MSEVISIDVKTLPLCCAQGRAAWCDYDFSDTAVILTVLIKRVEGTYKAYQAIVPDSSQQDCQYSVEKVWVAKYGNKLSWREANTIWPELKSELYAR